MLTVPRLKELLSYDTETGKFYWVIGRGGNAPAGREAGTYLMGGYISIYIDGRRYLAHRLAWLWCNGAWPQNQIDHINRIRDDNRIANLRQATASQNKVNSIDRSKSRGVYQHKGSRTWNARVHIAGKSISLGFYKTKSDAIAARRMAEPRFYGEFAP